MTTLRRVGRMLAGLLVTIVCAAPLAVAALASRSRKRPIEIGFGPEPLLNHVSAVKACRAVGIRAESYCVIPYYITRDFDRILDEDPAGPVDRLPARRLWIHLFGFVWAIRRYRIHAVSCRGGLLGVVPFLRAIEPLLLRLAGVRTLVLPYGSDVQRLPLNPNPRFRRALELDYPDTIAEEAVVRRQTRRWSRHADLVVNGCDWVDYLERRDLLTLGHFTIDPVPDHTRWSAPVAFTADRPLRILHAPNHEAIKGTEALRSAVDALRGRGHHLELRIVRGRPNDEVLREIDGCDLVVDQLVIGWYALFALEGMSRGRAVVCHVRDDLRDYYVDEGILEADELPLIDANETGIEDVLHGILVEPARLERPAADGPGFADRHHGPDAMGRRYREMLDRLGVPVHVQ